MRICDFHAVNLDEYEIIKLICQDGCIKLSNDFADGSRLSGAWRAGYVDTGSRGVGDGCFEVGIDGLEFFFSAGEGSGDC